MGTAKSRSVDVMRSGGEIGKIVDNMRNDRRLQHGMSHVGSPWTSASQKASVCARALVSVRWNVGARCADHAHDWVCVCVRTHVRVIAR